MSSPQFSVLEHVCTMDVPPCGYIVIERALSVMFSGHNLQRLSTISPIAAYHSRLKRRCVGLRWSASLPLHSSFDFHNHLYNFWLSLLTFILLLCYKMDMVIYNLIQRLYMNSKIEKYGV